MKRVLLIIFIISRLAAIAQLNPNKVLTPVASSKENLRTKQSSPSFSFIDRSSFTAGVCSGIINLHGNDCVRLPLSQDYYFTSGFTWETWFNSSWFENNDNSFRFGQSLLLTEDPVLCEDIQLGFGWQNIPRNAIGFVVDGPGQCGSRDNNPCFYRPPGGFIPNTWYHVAGVRNYLTNQTLLYFNGQLVDTKTNTLPPFNRNILTRIGSYTFANDSGFVGKMDEIRFWKIPRSGSEILANYNKCLTGNEAGLAAYYRSNESNGLILHNAVNNPSLDGTLDPTVSWDNTLNAPLINNCFSPLPTTVNATICLGQLYEGYGNTGIYTDTFIGSNGCDSIRVLNLTVTPLGVDAGPGDIICSPNSTGLQGTASGATQFAWTPAIYLNNPGILNPTATPPVTTWFYLTASNTNGCSGKDSVLVSVRSATAFAINPPADICSKKTIQLSASGGDTFVWQPSATLDNPVIFNPTATPSATTIYSVFITDTVCNNTTTLSTTITVLPLPLIKASKRNDIDCSTPQSQLSASGGIQYNWAPAGSLNNANSGSPIATPTLTTQYIVTGTNLAGCSNLDSVIVKVSADNKGGYFMPNGFTPNNDGLNDCFGVRSWGTITEIDFSIFNRWGERIFYSKKIGDCWNGVYKGVKQNPDVYVYMVRAKTTCQAEVFRKGTFILIR